MHEGLIAALDRNGLKSIPFPYTPTDNVVDGIHSAEGVYINFLQIQGMIFVPSFGLADDRNAAEILGGLFPHCLIVPVPCSDLAMGGGVLNCATWNVKAVAAIH